MDLPTSSDSARLVPAEIFCLACGYDLRGLREEGRCPECGQAVRFSLGRKFLSAAPVSFVALLRVSLLLKALVFGWCILNDSLFFIPERYLDNEWYTLGGRFLNFAFAVVDFGASLWIAMPCREARWVAAPGWWARAVRVTAGLNAAGALLDLFLQVTRWNDMHIEEQLSLIQIYIMPGALLIVFYMACLRWMACKIPDAVLARRSWHFGIALGVVQLLYVPVLAVYWRHPPGDPAGAGATLFLHGLLVGEMVLNAAGIGFLLHWWKRLKGLRAGGG